MRIQLSVGKMLLGAWVQEGQRTKQGAKDINTHHTLNTISGGFAGGGDQFFLQMVRSSNPNHLRLAHQL